jgi:hypothetical protein
MDKLGQYLLAHRTQAALLALTLATLPLLSLLAIVLIALVTLRQGWQAGLAILIATLAPNLAVFWFAKVDVVSLAIVSSINIVVWILAIELRRSLSWAWTIQVGAGLGIAVVCILHLVYPEVVEWWQGHMQVYLDQVKQVWASVPAEKMQAFIQRAAKIATGVQAAMVLSMGLLGLMAGRYWQARLFNPGQLRPELHHIRLSRSFVVVLILLALAGGIGRIEMGIDVLPIIAVVLAVAGLSVVHCVAKERKISLLWFVLFYIISSLLAVYFLVALCLIGLIDSFWDVRSKLVKKS